MSEESTIKIELKDRKYIRIEPTVTTDEGNPLFLTKLNVVESTECTRTTVSRKEYTCYIISIILITFAQKTPTFTCSRG